VNRLSPPSVQPAPTPFLRFQHLPNFVLSHGLVVHFLFLQALVPCVYDWYKIFESLNASDLCFAHEDVFWRFPICLSWWHLTRHSNSGSPLQAHITVTYRTSIVLLFKLEHPHQVSSKSWRVRLPHFFPLVITV